MAPADNLACDCPHGPADPVATWEVDDGWEIPSEADVAWVEALNLLERAQDGVFPATSGESFQLNDDIAEFLDRMEDRSA